MAKSKRKKKPMKQKHSFMLSLFLLLLAGYFLISFIDARLEIREREKQQQEVHAQYEAQLAENERLQSVVDGGDKKEYAERVAREKLGYVMPNEKVYYDITPSN